MPDPASIPDTSSTFQSAYGPYAFGVGAVLVLGAGAAVLWRLIVLPALSTLGDIAKNQAQTAQAMKDTTEAAERIMAQCTCRQQKA